MRSFLKVPHSTPANEGLGQLRNVHGRHHARLHVKLLQRILQHHGVHYRRQHADVVGRRTVHVAGALRNAAKDIAAADHDGDLYAQSVHRL